MLQYILKRLLLLPFLLFIFSIIAFVLIQAPPGDFLTSYIAELAASGSSMERAQIDALRALYGLDQPLHIQYFKWISRLVVGDLGISLDWQKPISELIGERMGLTLALGLGTFLFTWAVAIPIGMATAQVKRNVPSPSARVSPILSPMSSLMGFCQSKEIPKSPTTNRLIHLKY